MCNTLGICLCRKYIISNISNSVNNIRSFSCGVKHILTLKKARRRRLSVSPSLHSFDHIPFIIIYIHSDQSVFIFCRGSIHISSNHRFRRIFSGSYMLFCEEKILFRLFSPIYIRNIPPQHRPKVLHRNRYTF